MSRPRILIVDDEATACLLMRAALEQAGYEVTTAEDGTTALRLFQAAPCDLVMLDVAMPGLDGYQTCARLRAEAGEELPIVMVTGMDDLESVERAFQAGATDFIPKPIHWPLIGHRVRYLLRAAGLLRDLDQANARNAALLDAVPDTLLRLSADGRVLDARLAAWAEPVPADDAGMALTQLVPAEVEARILAAAGEARAGGLPANLEFQIATDGAQPRHYEARLCAIDARETLCLLRDISERKAAEQEIYRLAYFDTLTGLPNRLSFTERLDREIHRARQHHDQLVVLFLDLDGFKDVNDSLGYGFGDQLLHAVAERLRLGVRPADLVARHDAADMEVELARLGGDEFTLLIPWVRQGDDVLAVAERVHDLLRRPFELQGRALILTASTGIALYPEDGDDAATLLKHADTAMNHAKGQGRDNCQFYSRMLTEAASRRLDLDGHLRQALERKEFSLVYQPQLDLDSGLVHSMEALIRWHHPERGLVPPQSFIPLAEANGLIVPIGEWVLRHACAEAVNWRDGNRPLRVAVNLSAAQFRNPRLLDQIAETLRLTGLEADLLELEVTEGVLMENSEANLKTLYDLRAMGVRLALDDFGTGYSSLSYLKRLPFNTLKVDQSFVRGLPGDRESMAIVRAIVSLAKNLGFSITAEGIETEEQARILDCLGCETLQGHYVGEPIRAEDIPGMIEHHERHPLSCLSLGYDGQSDSMAVPNGVRVLLVEDEPTSRIKTEAILRHALGCEVVCASNGAEALSKAREFQPRIVITDWLMPVMDSIEFCRALRAREWGLSMYLVMLTCVETEEQIVEAFEAGVDDYVTKPVDTRALTARMRAALHYVKLLESWEHDRDQLRRYAAELAQSSRRLRHAAMTDLLTGLPNRRAGMEALAKSWSASQRNGQPVAALMIDIDRFKSINDRYGHAVGDQVLREVANAIQSAARKDDNVSRVGGEEFLLLCNCTDTDTALLAAERLRKLVRSLEMSVAGIDVVLKTSISIGVAIREDAMQDADELIRAADQALYSAKHAGRDRVCLYITGETDAGDGG
jgi:diguanylate cyclase (GGDEF)-like protein